MIPDEEIYPVSCQVSKVLVLSFFFYLASSLWNSLDSYLPTCNIQYINNKH